MILLMSLLKDTEIMSSDLCGLYACLKVVPSPKELFLVPPNDLDFPVRILRTSSGTITYWFLFIMVPGQSDLSNFFASNVQNICQ